MFDIALEEKRPGTEFLENKHIETEKELAGQGDEKEKPRRSIGNMRSGGRGGKFCCVGLVKTKAKVKKNSQRNSFCYGKVTRDRTEPYPLGLATRVELTYSW